MKTININYSKPHNHTDQILIVFFKPMYEKAFVQTLFAILIGIIPSGMFPKFV
jgi:hypothetical protein